MSGIDEKQQIQTYRVQGEAYYKLHDLTKSRECFEEIIALQRGGAVELHEIAYAHTYLARIAIQTGQWDKAATALMIAGALYQESGDKWNAMQQTAASGWLHLLRGDYIPAKGRFIQVVEEARKCGDDPVFLAHVLSGKALAMVYPGNEDPHTAVQYITEALLLIQSNEVDSCELMIYGASALAHARAEQPQNATRTVYRGLSRTSPAACKDVFDVFACFAMTEAALLLREERMDASADEQARIDISCQQSIDYLHQFVENVPVAHARALVYQIWYDGIHQNLMAMNEHIDEVLDLTDFLRMPVERSMAYLHIGRFLPVSDARRVPYLRNAQDILQRLNAAYELQRVEKLLAHA
ncbi:MAG: hypothetical protein ACPG7F_02440 [Aggregatilineales bacterium]